MVCLFRDCNVPWCFRGQTWLLAYLGTATCTGFDLAGIEQRIGRRDLWSTVPRMFGQLDFESITLVWAVVNPVERVEFED